MSDVGEISVAATNAGELNKPKPRWMPLEGNPEVSHFESKFHLIISLQVLNKFLKKLGIKNTDYQFTEIYGFDEELLAFVPQPICAILVIFPITEQVKLYKNSFE